MHASNIVEHDCRITVSEFLYDLKSTESCKKWEKTKKDHANMDYEDKILKSNFSGLFAKLGDN